MAKQTGLGNRFFVDGVDISGDINALSRISSPVGVLELTDITEFAYERTAGQRDGGMTFTSFHDTAVGKEHLTLAPLPTADRLTTWLLGTALGADAATCNCKQINYDPTRDNAGNLTIEVDTQANGFGLDWGVNLCAGKRVDSAPTSPATGVDLGVASTSFGWTAYLHVFALTGSTVTFTLADSADNAAFTNLTGGAFTAVTTAPATQRLVPASPTATVREFVRVSTTGTFSSVTFAVLFTRNLAATNV